MDVVLTLEGVSVPLLVVHALDLNRSMEELVLAAEQVGNLSQRLEWLRRHNVASHGHFTDGDGPDVQIVHVLDVVAADFANVFSELLDVDGLRSALHHDDYNVLDNGDGRDHDNDREKVGAEGVEEPPGGEEVNDDGSDDDSDAHDDVAENVKERRIHNHVRLFVLMVVMMMVMVVVMVVVKVRKMLRLVTFLVVKQRLFHCIVLYFFLLFVLVQAMAVSVIVSVAMLMLVAMAVSMIVSMVVSMVMSMTVPMAVSVVVPMTVPMTVSMTVSMAMTMVMSVVVSMAVSTLRLAAKMEVAVTRVQNFHLDQVEDEAHYCNDEHDVSLYLRWFEEAHSRLIEEPSSHNPNGGH